MGTIFYKGESYSGEASQEQKIKAIDLDKFLEDLTEEERINFIEEFENDGFELTQSEDGYVTVPCSNVMVIDSAIVTNTYSEGDEKEDSGLIIHTDPEIINVELDNGVTKIYAPSDEVGVVVQGLRMLSLPFDTRMSMSYINISAQYNIGNSGHRDLPEIICQRTCDDTTIPSLNELVSSKTDPMYTSLETIVNMIQNGRIIKYIYSDYLTLDNYSYNYGYANLNAGISPALHSIYYKGQNNNGQYVYCHAQKILNNNDNPGTPWKDNYSRPHNVQIYRDWTFLEKPDIIGMLFIIPNFSLQKEPLVEVYPYNVEEVTVGEEIKHYLKYDDSRYAWREEFPVPVQTSEGIYKNANYYPGNRSNAEFKQISKKNIVGREPTSDNLYTQQDLWVTSCPIALKKNTNDQYELLPFASNPFYETNRNSLLNGYPINPTIEEYQTLAALQSRTQPIGWEDKINNIFN